MDKQKTPMSSKDRIRLVKAVYSYVMLVVGIIMLSIGVVRGVNTLANLIFLDEYPYSGEEYMCDYTYMRDPASEIKYTEAEITESEEDCAERGEIARQKAKVQDVSVSLAMTLLGNGIIYFHSKMVKKLDDEK